MLGNTPQHPVDFFVERAKSFAFSVKVQFEDGTPFDFTGASVRCTIAEPRRLGGDIVLLISGQDVGVDGVRQFQIQASELDLTPGEYPYDLTLQTAEGYSVPLSKGVFAIGANVDVIDNNVFDFSDPDQWITFTIKNGATIKTVIKNSLALSSIWVNGAPGELTELFKEAIRDVVADFLRAGSNVTLTHNDAGNTLTISSMGGGGGGTPYVGLYPGPDTFPGPDSYPGAGA